VPLIVSVPAATVGVAGGVLDAAAGVLAGSEGRSVNVAVALRAWVMTTVQEPMPVQAPLQPVKTSVPVGVAVSVTEVASLNVAVHVAPQVIPLGLDETDPAPVPEVATVRVQTGMNVAVTDRACVIETVQVPVPVQAPLQPVKTSVPVGVAVSVTEVASSNVAVQVAPQVMPLGLDEIEPEPLPAAAAVSVQTGINAAVTLRACVIETVQVPVPVHAPLQPEKREPAVAVGVRVTDVPVTKS
jgi:hypothetical protein